MAEAYSNFAAVYDALMDNIPYDAWADYLHGLLVEYDIASGILAELGCGTGNITERMADFGYDMIGIDNSPAMLDIANEKREQNHSSSLYLCQDMREFELYGTVAATASIILPNRKSLRMYSRSSITTLIRTDFSSSTSIRSIITGMS